MRKWLRAAEESNRLIRPSTHRYRYISFGCHRRELFSWEAKRSEALKQKAHGLGLKGLLLHLTRLRAKQEVWKKQSLKMLLMHEIVIVWSWFLLSIFSLKANSLIWICRTIWGTHTALLTKQINRSNPDELSLCTKVIKFKFSQKGNFCYHLRTLISLQFHKQLFISVEHKMTNLQKNPVTMGEKKQNKTKNFEISLFVTSVIYSYFAMCFCQCIIFFFKYFSNIVNI